MKSLRLSPPSGSALWREVTDGGLSIDRQVIPEGCNVGTSIYSVHHSAAHFADPLVFRPERWLSPKDEHGIEPTDELLRARAVYNPLSHWTARLRGQVTPLNELMLTMASLLVELDFRTAPGADGRVGDGDPEADFGRHRVMEYQMKDFVTGQRNGPLVQLRKRSPSGMLPN